MGLLRSMRTQSEFWRQRARAVPIGERGLVSVGMGRGGERERLRMSLHEDGIVAKGRRVLR